MKRVLLSALIGCSVAVFPLAMWRIFPAELPASLYLVYAPGIWASFLTRGRNGDTESLTFVVVACCAFYSVAVYALASLRSAFTSAGY